MKLMLYAAGMGGPFVVAWYASTVWTKGRGPRRNKFMQLGVRLLNHNYRPVKGPAFFMR